MRDRVVMVENVGQHSGQEVRICGWVYSKRSSGKIKFILLRDGTGIIQCVLVKDEVDPETFERYNELTQETSVVITGVINEDARAPIGFEMLVRGLEIVQVAEEYPITPKEHSTAYLLDRRHLWIRSSKQNAVLRVRAEVIRAVRNFLDEEGFILADTPIFTPTSCEGTSTLFETKYFD
ncbi:MAG: asparagine--tRNA ligase, partial [Candidatus Coatesbacteria bacterium]|nr:asparagine--tRNA ligase [Candidatus Coatesbacteria bacterium]